MILAETDLSSAAASAPTFLPAGASSGGSLPVDSGTLLAIGACALVVGLCLLLWGRLVGRLFLVLAGAAAGAALAPMVQQATGWTNVDPWIARGLCAAPLAACGFFLARLVWTLWGVGVFSLAALGGLIFYYQNQHPDVVEGLSKATSSLDAFAAEALHYVQHAVGALWQDAQLETAVAIGAGAAVPLIVGMVSKRTTTVLMTAVTGAIAAVGGAAAIFRVAAPEKAAALIQAWYVPAGLCGFFLLVGLVFQGRGIREAARAAAEEAQDADEEEEEEDEGPGGKKAKKQKGQSSKGK